MILTDYICWLIAKPRTQPQARDHATTLGIRSTWASFYFDNVRRG